MSKTTRPKVVCFDLGGVLVRICRSWSEACSQAGLPERAAQLLSSEQWQTRRHDIVERYQRGELECASYHAALTQALQGSYSVSEVERIHDAWTLREYPGAFELVCSLNALPELTTACLSNTNHAHWQRLAGADGRREYPSVLELRHQLASHLLGCSKPDARIYELARAKFSELEVVHPEHIVFFDDLLENVLAARAMGWTAFTVDHAGDTVGQMRRHLAELGVRA
jgi:FMN phosphatase YigB (HAD superfamily)